MILTPGEAEFLRRETPELARWVAEAQHAASAAWRREMLQRIRARRQGAATQAEEATEDACSPGSGKSDTPVPAAEPTVPLLDLMTEYLLPGVVTWEQVFAPELEASAIAGVSNYCLLTVSQPQSPVAQGYDCSNIWERNHTATSGIYMIKPRNAQFGFQVYCEMSGSGGWTLIQNHNGEDHLDFYATWIEYENGFGRLQGEHWLGLKNMYALTHQTQRRCKLHISLGDFDGNEAYAEYRSFSIGEANKFYKLSAANYSGTAGDAFLGFPDIPGSNQHGSYFSTWDNYHDKCHPLCGSSDIKYRSCSDQYGAGWWFNACGLANLNGVWHAAPDYQHWSTSVSWPSWRFTDSLKFSKMFLIHY
ncbi:fibrinogen-like protein 1 [Phyllobates terribilis]|uniref:fibrinogen-like protein 1 n=1 Tax=Phyllobates terribilis TaxID=111132 RepID=UPI003CCB68A5